MTFTEINELISNGAITGPQVGVCNCINSLATASRERAGNIEGLIGQARDINDTSERVYFNSVDPNFLVILGIASVMGIQLHNNLKTENAELWAELNTLINSKYFKTFISLPEDLATTILGDISTASEGAPAILTSTGELYLSGDLMEAVFQSLHNAGAFATSEGSFTPLDLPESGQVESYNLINTNLTLAQFEELLNNRWGDFQALATDSHSSTADVTYPILNLNSFTEFLTQLKNVMGETDYNAVFNNFNGGYFHAQKRAGRYNYFDYNLFIITTPITNPAYPIINYNGFGRDGYYIVGNSYYDSSNFFTGHYIKITYSNGTWYLTDTGGSYPVYTANGDNFIYGGDYYTYAGEWSFYQYEGGGGDTPAGLNQEEGATIPSPNDNSFTNWAASNLTTYDNSKLITNALATQNIPAHSQNWYKIAIPYSFGYDLQLNGETEEPEGGAVTQNHELLTSQQEESEDAGLTDTGTNTTTIINVYNAENGSEPLNDNQKDEGDVELEELPADDWKAAGSTGIYCPNSSQLEQIENWLWNVYPSSASEFFQNPMEAFIALYKTYFPHTPAGSQEVVFGYVGSGVNSPVTNRYHEYSLGQIHVGKTFNNYMDYSGNASIYVPFCGFQSVDLKDIMDADIELIYRVEFLTGAGVAILMVERDEMSAPLYVWPVNVFESVPFSSFNAMGTYAAGINAIGNTIGGIVGGLSSGSIGAALTEGLGKAAGSVSSLIQSAHVQQGGSLSGNGAMQGPKKAYLTIRYNKNSTPEAYKEFEGVGTDTVSTIGSFNGYVKFRDVKLTGIIGASNEVLEDIESALKEGVYI